MAIFTCALKWKFQGLIYTEVIGCNECSESLQLMKHEVLPPDLNGIRGRSRVPACFKTNFMFYNGIMHF